MLQLKNISKHYKLNNFTQRALDNISLSFRDNEFVSILGPSGSGKTTCLNIIGGLDSYGSGDLIINGISTSDYKDRDWDTYRNHTIGFVFQSYNLIPHQSVLGNVELALTIAGLTSSDKKERAKQALLQVGLGEHMNKKPNQLSGGQMQRVAIARALVNNPDIILADEPTGALDTETSVQIMKLLKEVANDRLVVMVTHNGELAEEYSTRIIKLKDGQVVDDSDPFEVDELQMTRTLPPLHKSKMSLSTAVSLSFNNLKTKKKRTILTAFSGSIGIIGIALILSLSNGVNTYIDNLQKETMTAYPIVIEKETIDINSMMGLNPATLHQGIDVETRNAMYADNTELKVTAQLEVYNNLESFKQFLDNTDNEIHNFIGQNGINYSYNVNFEAYTKDPVGQLINTNADTSSLLNTSGTIDLIIPSSSAISNAFLTGSSSSTNAYNFSQLPASSNGELINSLVTDNYKLVAGDWPSEWNEVVLVLDYYNSINITTLYQLGFITAEDLVEINDAINASEKAENYMWAYDDALGKQFYMLLDTDKYMKDTDGIFVEIEDIENLIVYQDTLTVVGIIKPNELDINTIISTPIAYTSLLTNYVIDSIDNSPVVLAQEKTPEINVLNGMRFEEINDTEKLAMIKEYLLALSTDEKASMYQFVIHVSQNSLQESLLYMEISMMAEVFDSWVQSTPDNTVLFMIYDMYIGGHTYEGNMELFGKLDYNQPDMISIYVDNFEDKTQLSYYIEQYNSTVSEDDQIIYSDIVGSMVSSMMSMIDIISYVLIAFVGVSLVVSSIMIGIITHISVIERTKEIGVLRALGASKANISQVFNAETLIIGLFSGGIGVVTTYFINIPVTNLIQMLVKSDDIVTSLPAKSAWILVGLSVVITVIGGLLPANSASRRNPVVALRSE
ncbi:MAG: ABC transporter [Epulopiscium sp. Nele67-Bin004]|nr:MAG: ABC transporter [Epulopiscium sp. Nele67-Bin004]